MLLRGVSVGVVYAGNSKVYGSHYGLKWKADGAITEQWWSPARLVPYSQVFFPVALRKWYTLSNKLASSEHRIDPCGVAMALPWWYHSFNISVVTIYIHVATSSVNCSLRVVGVVTIEIAMHKCIMQLHNIQTLASNSAACSWWLPLPQHTINLNCDWR